MKDPKADITNPGATRDHGAANAVRRGMELLTWRYPDGEWQRHREARARRRWMATLGDRPRAVVQVTPWIIGCVAGVGLLAALLADSGIGAALSGLALLASVVAGLMRSRGARNLIDDPEVLFTSTGVLFGEHARRWRGYRYKLNEVRVRSGELTHLEPAYLEIEFSTGWRETIFSIPVPSGLEQDAVEIAAKLEDMMLGLG